MKNLLLGFILVLSDKKVTPKSSLKAVFMLIRHGDRAPTCQYPKDPHNFYQWRAGLGAITKRGEDQMVTCGTIKRKRYASLIDKAGPAYEINNVAILSSTVERCVISARRFLDGFLNKKSQKEDIIVLPGTEDEFLVVRGKRCPKYIMPFYESLHFENPVVQKYFRTNGISSTFFDYLEANTGMKMYSLMEIHGLADILHVQQKHGLTPPKWVNAICQSTLMPLAWFAYELMIKSDYMRVRSGVLVRDIIERMNKYLTNESKENIVIYSAHDLTISALVNHLDLGNQINFKPDYGSCFAVELYENPSILNDLEVKLFFFRDFADENPMSLRIPNCEAPCSLTKFNEVMQSKITQNYEDACRKDKYRETKSMGETISAHSVHNCNDNNNPNSSNTTQSRHKNQERTRQRLRERKTPQATLRQTNSRIMKKVSKTSSAYSKGKTKRSRSRRRAEQSDEEEAMDTDQAREGNGSGNEDANSSAASSISSNDSHQQNQSRHDVRKIDTADALHLSKKTSTTRPSTSNNNPTNIVPVNGAATLNSLSQNPFFNYLQDLRKKHKDLSVQELAKKGGQKWRSMSMEEKFPYFVMAKKYREYRLKRLQKGPERGHSRSKAELKNEAPSSKSNISKKNHKSNSKNSQKKKQESNNYHSYVS